MGQRLRDIGQHSIVLGHERLAVLVCLVLGGRHGVFDLFIDLLFLLGGIRAE